MKKLFLPLLLCVGFVLISCKQDPPEVITPPPPPPPAQNLPELPDKTNPAKLYMHYMPWFNTKEFSGFWGYHWTMLNKNPDRTLSNGNLEIASHYYPLIGPYDSSDPDVADYHLLLMKYAGIDGVLIDWYGSHDVNDFGINLDNSNVFIEGVERTGMKYGIVYEEFTAELVAENTNFTDIDAARADMRYIKQNYFSSLNYITFNSRPLLLTFGPRYFRTASEWGQILRALDQTSSFFPLWNFTNLVGSGSAAGEFSWVDFSPNLDELASFYQNNDKEDIIGSIYPGFHDFYEEGGAGSSFGYVPHNSGQTLTNTISTTVDAGVPVIQLVTWNDFGEGTMFEPTQEFGFQFLEQIQQLAGVSYDKTDLERVYQYYLERKENVGNAPAQETLDEIFDALNTLDVTTADSLLATLQ
ncbi:MAG: glycoside hydrolase family 71/99-like protein [Bacteroidota bacterium]